MAQSLAFWIDSSQGQGENLASEIEIHTNFWLLNHNSETYYLDIGIKFIEINEFENLCIYLPFSRQACDIDFKLSEIVCDNDDLVESIFNEPIVKSTPLQGGLAKTFEFKNDKKITIFHELSDAKTEDLEEGICVKIPRQIFRIEGIDKKDIDNHYIRFRVSLNKKSSESIYRKASTRFNIFTNNYYNDEMIDFRVNETRNLSKRVRKLISNCTFLKISKVHFFLIRDANSDFKMAHESYERCRVIERDAWEKYLSFNESLKESRGKKKKGCNHNDMLIYHWKRSKKDKDHLDYFSAFAKFGRHAISPKDILLGILLVILLSWGASSLPSASYLLAKALDWHGKTEVLADETGGKSGNTVLDSPLSSSGQTQHNPKRVTAEADKPEEIGMRQ